jgi:hypothetical protein
MLSFGTVGGAFGVGRPAGLGTVECAGIWVTGTVTLLFVGFCGVVFGMLFSLRGLERQVIPFSSQWLPASWVEAAVHWCLFLPHYVI